MNSPAVQSAFDALVSAIRGELRSEFLAVLGDGHEIGNGYRTTGRKKPGPKPKAASKTRAKGAKRSPEELEALTKAFLAAIKKAPGSRVEQLAETLGTSTKDLALPALKLFEAKSIKTTGQRRGTKYFPK